MISDDISLLTTTQAANLIHVHESSVKRWCRQGALACSVTEGGHRRIALQDLLGFANDRMLPCALGSFSSEALEVWSGLRDAQAKKEFDGLFRKAYAWLINPSPDFFRRLMFFCLEQGITFSELFDNVIARALRQVGTDWHNNELDVGTEHYITEIVRDVMYAIRHDLHEARQSTESVRTEDAPRRALVGCNAGNQHDMGAQAIRILLEQQGWEIIYLGANVPVNDFASLQLRHEAQLVCVSFVASNVRSEVERFIDVLAKFYDAGKPYHLVIGGSTFPPDVETPLTHPPFANINAYGSTFMFNEWLDGYPFTAAA